VRRWRAIAVSAIAYAAGARLFAAVAGAAFLVALLAAGCGKAADAEAVAHPATLAAPAPPPPPPTEATPPPPPQKHMITKSCSRARLADYRFCWTEKGRRHRQVGASVEVKDGDRWRAVTRPLPGAALAGTGVWQWLDVRPSPDGRWLLLELGLECDTHRAFLVPASGGVPRPATGERDWRQSPDSLAQGWSADGRASIWVLGGLGDCGNTSPEPGRYLVDPATGELDYVGKLPPPYDD
jgi:hypothetical protein